MCTACALRACHSPCKPFSGGGRWSIFHEWGWEARGGDHQRSRRDPPPPAICQNLGGGVGWGVLPGVGGGGVPAKGRGGVLLPGVGGGLAGGQGGVQPGVRGGGVRVRVTELVEPVLVL